ncbi:hypothetical protein BC833DRAFT_539495 [Globomyces pollinis-pini]|nr:hypothetical protein BC833DRAFT_539495 [Globomyces pollinis-pini]
MFSKAAALTVLLATTNALYSAPQFVDVKVSLMKDSRDKFTFVPYTPEERVAAAKNVENLFQVYGNRFVKIEDYGAEFPNIDPAARAAEITKNAAKMTDKEFHYKNADLFLSMRDAHTVYYMPAPHACYLQNTAVGFAMIDSKDIDNDPVVVVSGFSSRQVVRDQSPQISKVTVGDKLVTVDGLKYIDYMKQNKFINGGANTPAALRRGLRSGLSGGLLAVQKPKPNDTVKYVLERPDKTTYEVELPWVILEDQKCIASTKDIPAAPVNFKDDFGVNPDFIMQDLMENNKNSITYVNTVEPRIKWGIYNSETTNLGVIQLGTFSTAISPDDTVLLIRDIVTNKLADTNAIVFDIRSNGGGYGIIAQKLPQLFVQNVIGTKARAVVNDVNLRFMPTQGPEWIDAAKRSKLGDKYTPLVQPETDDANLNLLGQAYLKPVGILNDGVCYSACDYFSATMQDNAAAVMFGEDNLTGAGGANVITIEAMSSAAPKDFTPLAYAGRMPFAQSISVAFGAGIRVGPNEGKPIENYGIKPEYIVRPTIDEIKVQTSNGQFDRVAAKLKEIGEARGINNLFFKSAIDYDVVGRSDETLKLEFESSGLKTVSVAPFKGSSNIADISKKTKGTLEVPLGSENGYSYFSFLGVDAKGKNVLKTQRRLRVIPSLAKYAKIDKAGVNLQTGSPVIYNLGSSLTTPANGWVKNKDTFTIGKGLGFGYAEAFDSTLSYFIQPVSSLKLALAIDYDTEEDYDYVRVGYTDSKGTTYLTKDAKGKNGVSGVGKLSINSEIKPEGAFELFIAFNSDSNTIGKGITLQSISISAPNSVDQTTTTTSPATTQATTTSGSTLPTSSGVTGTASTGVSITTSAKATTTEAASTSAAVTTSAVITTSAVAPTTAPTFTAAPYKPKKTNYGPVVIPTGTPAKDDAGYKVPETKPAGKPDSKPSYDDSKPAYDAKTPETPKDSYKETSNAFMASSGLLGFVLAALL